MVTGTPTVWMGPADRGWIVWMQETSTNQFTYTSAVMAPTGGIAVKPADTFSGAPWVSLSVDPNLLAHGAEPVLVFSGIGPGTAYSKDCIVGALPSAKNWSPQVWSLSNSCSNPNGSAGEGKNGVLGAAWPGAWATGRGVLYHIGVSQTIPAGTADGRITATDKEAVAFKTGVASDIAGNGHFYVAYVQGFSNPASQDGMYVKDVTANSVMEKAPGSGTQTASDMYAAADLAVVNTSNHAGVWLAYCGNSSPCTLKLWRYGSKTPLTVPGSSDSSNVAVSAGPDGRLWVAFFNHSTNAVSVVRTNEADTAFGKVETYSTPCFEDGLIGLSGGAWGRLNVALDCVRTSDFKVETYATQALTSLALSPSSHTILNTATRSVTFKVTDVGDPVEGATVTVDGKHATTGPSGNATFSFAIRTAPGTYRVTAAANNYYGASASLTVKK